MLQKPSAKSKARDHSKYLTKRLEQWQKGELDQIMAEANEIQKRMKKAQDKKKEESREKAFVRLMMLGKIGPAAKYVNNDDNVKGVHSLNAEIKEILQSKHPQAREVDPHVVLEYNNQTPQPVI